MPSSRSYKIYIFFGVPPKENRNLSPSNQHKTSKQTTEINKRKTPKQRPMRSLNFYSHFSLARLSGSEREFRNRKKSSQQNPRKPKINYPEDGKNIPSRKSSSTEQGTKKDHPINRNRVGRCHRMGFPDPTTATVRKSRFLLQPSREVWRNWKLSRDIRA